jgi:hypothetical protein
VPRPRSTLANFDVTINTHNNVANGVQVHQNSTLTFAVNAQLISTANSVGLLADDGAAVTLVNSTLTGNTTKDLQLTFGTRADVQTTTLGTHTCDATVLARHGRHNVPALTTRAGQLE